jgi:hypothetical protein
MPSTQTWHGSGTVQLVCRRPSGVNTVTSTEVLARDHEMLVPKDCLLRLG